MGESLIHPLIVLVLKPLLYIGLFRAACYFWWKDKLPLYRLYVAAGITRCALGYLIGVPAGLLLADRLEKLDASSAVFYAIYFALRLGLWVGTTKFFFRPLTYGQATLLGLCGVALNALIDALWTTHGGLRQAFNINFC
jgi:hypothetical protein